MPFRKRIPSDTETRILSKSARRCCLCFYLNQDFTEKLGQIAHLDRDSSNASEDNLAFLCMDHHSMYDSRTSQHKNLTIGEVKSARRKLYEEFECRKPCEWLLVLDGTFSEFDKARVEAIVEHLRKVLGDPHLTIKRTDPGSINLVIESSLESFEKMKRLVESAELKEIDGCAIRKINRLDEAGFEEFWKENWDALVRYIKTRLSNQTEAEDVALQAFERAWRTRNFSRETLLLEARWMAVSSYRRQQRAAPALEAFELEAPHTPLDTALLDEQTKVLRDSIALLSPRARAVITLSYMAQFTAQEVAEALGITPEMVRALRARALRELRKIMREALPKPPHP
jgi:RNA polymerase sigma factor (sigma-70 family)